MEDEIMGVASKQEAPPPETQEQAPEINVAEKTTAELERLKKALAASDRKITELSQKGTDETTKKLAAQMEYQNELQNINLQANTWDEQTLAKQRQEANKKYQAEMQKINYAEAYGKYKQDMMDDFNEIVEGVDVPEMQTLRNELDSAAAKGEVLEKFVRKAAKIIKESHKPVDTKKMAEDIERQVMEKMKRGGSLSVDKSGPGGASGTNRDILRRYNEGDRSVTREDVRKALGL